VGSALVPLRRNRDFVLLQVGQGLSTVGSSSSEIAYPLLVLAVTHSPPKAGLVGFARLVPYGVFGLLAGVASDRFDRKRLMLVADAVRAVALASIVLALAFDQLSFVQITVVAFVEGTMFAVFNVAEMGALRSVVPARQLPVAAAAEQARIGTVELVGPPLGGALFGLARSLPFLVDALSYAFSLGSLLAMRTPFQERREPEPRAVLRAQLAEGFRWLWRHRFLRTCAVLFTWLNLVFEGLLLVLIVAGRRQGLSGGEIGALFAVIGACLLIGSLLAPRLQRALSMRMLVTGGLWIQLCIGAFLIEPSVYVLLAGALPSVLITPTVNAVVIGYRAAIVPDRLIGRVTSVARTLALFGAPLGPLVAGLLLGSLSARETVAVFVGVLVALALIATASPSIRAAPSLAELDELPGAPGSG
jgi:MFS family permease